MFKLDTEKELYNFLKVLTQESVKLSKQKLREQEEIIREQKLKDRELGISRLDENNNLETPTKNTLESFEIDKTTEN